MRDLILSPRDIDRYWAKVDKRDPGECWPWMAGTDRGGYGRFRHNGKRLKSHRVSYFLEHGVWPEPCGLHECDNPPCCNPAHIFEGTQRDNMRDAYAKGRLFRFVVPEGEDNPNAKLTSRIVADIRRRYANHEATQAELGMEYGICQAYVSRIVLRKQWRETPQ